MARHEQVVVRNRERPVLAIVHPDDLPQSGTKRRGRAVAAIPVRNFDQLAARPHARLRANLAKAGSDVGPHNRIVAATAISLGWRVATANVRQVARIPELDVVEVR